MLDAAVLKDTLVFSYDWPKDRSSVRWSLVSSSLLKALDGVYRLASKGSGTDVTYELTLDLAMPDDRIAQAQGRAQIDRHRIEGSEETSRG